MRKTPYIARRQVDLHHCLGAKNRDDSSRRDDRSAGRELGEGPERAHVPEIAIEHMDRVAEPDDEAAVTRDGHESNRQ